jgi:mannose-6-phosphate isomerase-like protein (cupin superfamily)
VDKINLAQKLALIQQPWSPAIVAELNGQHVKLARLEGAYVWHRHEHEDELFFVVSGKLSIELRGRTIELAPGEFFVVPRGVEHRPVAQPVCEIMLFEPASTINTGDATPNAWTRKPEQLDRL